jgi:transcription termination factor Rho
MNADSPTMEAIPAASEKAVQSKPARKRAPRKAVKNSKGKAAAGEGSEAPDLFELAEAAPASAPSDPIPSGGGEPEAKPTPTTEAGAAHPGGEASPKKKRGRRKRRGQRDAAFADGESPEDDGRFESVEEGEMTEGYTSVSSDDENGSGPSGEGKGFKTRKQRFLERRERERARELAALESSPSVESEGLVEISPKGFGFLREKIRNFDSSPRDVFITPEIVRVYGLRDGHMVRCVSKVGIRGPQLVEVLSINDRPPEECARLPYFEELTAINPNKKLTLETESGRLTTRVVDLVSPIGRGQRGLIVAPPRTGKTTFLHHIAEGLLKNYEDEVHLMVLLVDERPEEVTDFERSFPGVEIFSSSNDAEAKDHTRIALLAIERAKRLVEGGRHVVMLMDSITRLARAFNSLMRGGGGRGTASGGLIVGALEMPRRIFAAARNTREAGSLTIIATALVQTNSKADEAIFQEFKGTGNMELVLDRQLAQNYVYPAVDINKSGTRREELLLPPHVLEKIYVIRRGLGGYRPLDAMEWLLRCLQRYPSNAQMLMDIKMSALT